jgi:hypothetical protein
VEKRVRQMNLSRVKRAHSRGRWHIRAQSRHGEWVESEKARNGQYSLSQCGPRKAGGLCIRPSQEERLSVEVDIEFSRSE